MSESTWKIIKLDWKTPGIFSTKRVGTLYPACRWASRSKKGRYKLRTGCIVKTTPGPLYSQKWLTDMMLN